MCSYCSAFQKYKRKFFMIDNQVQLPPSSKNHSEQWQHFKVFTHPNYSASLFDNFSVTTCVLNVSQFVTLDKIYGFTNFGIYHIPFPRSKFGFCWFFVVMIVMIVCHTVQNLRSLVSITFYSQDQNFGFCWFLL